MWQSLKEASDLYNRDQITEDEYNQARALFENKRLPFTLEPQEPRDVRMVSKYNGFCVVCKNRISIGDEIYWNTGTRKTRHFNCDLKEVVTEQEEIVIVTAEPEVRRRRFL